MSDAPKNAPRTWNDALDKDDLTTAYLFGYHKRDYKVQEQADRIEALEAKLDEAVEALRPFGEAGKDYMGKELCDDLDGPILWRPSLRQIRRARAALAKLTGEQP